MEVVSLLEVMPRERKKNYSIRWLLLHHWPKRRKFLTKKWETLSCQFWQKREEEPPSFFEKFWDQSAPPFDLNQKVRMSPDGLIVGPWCKWAWFLLGLVLLDFSQRSLGLTLVKPTMAWSWLGRVKLESFDLDLLEHGFYFTYAFTFNMNNCHSC